MSDKRERIRALNDRFRRSFAGGRVVMTASIAALPFRARAKITKAVQAFDAFTPDNDPHREHDFGRLEVDDQVVIFKIDYFAKGSDYSAGAEHPEDEATTDRVMTIMAPEEY